MADYSGMDADAAMGSEAGYGGDYGGGSYGLEGGTVGDANAFGIESSPGFGLNSIGSDFAAFDPAGMGMGDIGVASGSYSDAGSYGGPTAGLSLEDILGRIPAPMRALAQFGLTKANPALGATIGMAGKAATAGRSPAGAGAVFGSTLGGTLGSIVGGPLGGLVGGTLGGRAGASALGGVPGYSGPSAGPGAGEGIYWSEKVV